MRQTTLFNEIIPTNVLNDEYVGTNLNLLIWVLASNLNLLIYVWNQIYVGLIWFLTQFCMTQFNNIRPTWLNGHSHNNDM